jgi:hypothetical protein
MLPARPCVGSLRLGDVAQVGDHAAQPRRVEPSGGVQQHRLGLDRGPRPQVLGAPGQLRGMRRGDLPGRQRPCGAGQRAAVQRPGDPDALGGVGGAQPGPAAQPARGGDRLNAVLGAGGTAGVHRGQLAQPLALQPLQQPPQHQYPRGRLGVGLAGEVLAGELIDRRRQAAEACGPLHRTCVRVHGGTLPAAGGQAKGPPPICGYRGSWRGR